MIDDVKNEALQEMAEQVEPEQEQPIEEAPEQEATQDVEEAPAPKQKSSAQSFKELRTQKEDAERRAQELERQLMESRYYTQQIEMRNQQPQVPDEPLPHLSDSDLIEYKHLKRYERDLLAQKKEIEALKKQTNDAMQEAQLRAKYNDLDNVVTTANIKTLRSIDPDGARAMDEAQSLYAKGLIAYRLIKQAEIDKPEPDYEVDKQLAQRNANKPRSVATTQPQRGANPLTKASLYQGELTPELERALNKEMEEAIANRR